MTSLRTMLLGSILAATSAAWGFAGYFSFVDMRHEIQQMFDAHLAESARALLEQAGHERREARHKEDEAEDEGDDDSDDGHLELPDLRHRGQLFERQLVFQLWDKTGRLLMNSRRELPDKPLVPLSAEGFRDSQWKGQDIRVFAAWNHRRSLHIQVAEVTQKRLDLVKASLWNVLTPILVVILPLLIVLALAVEYALSTLRRLSADLTSRTPEDLAPLQETDAPKEMRPIMRALNGLFLRLNRALENERRFTANAAHELRTPLAAVKVQAQVAMLSRQEETRNRALEGVVKGIDRAAHLVEQLLTLARLDPDSDYRKEAVALQPLLVAVAGSLAPDAVAKDIELSVKESSDITLNGNRAMLEILLRNLIDNAIRYTPPLGAINIRWEESREHVELLVEDNGPGLTEDQKSQALARFARISRPSGEGSGLGLSIVQRIVELHKGTLSLESGADSRGLRVRVRFPRA